MPNVNLSCFLLSYLVAFGLDVARLRSKLAWSRWVAILFGGAGLLAHTLYLLLRSSQSQLPPLLSSAHDWLLVLAWLAVLTHLFVSLLDATIASGLVVWPIVLALVGASYLVTSSQSQVLDFHRGWKMLHAAMLVLGTATNLWQHRRLKGGQMRNSGLTLPSLERLERFNRWSILVSVPFLTFGVATGVLLSFLNDDDARLAWADPVVLGGSVMWLLMCGLFAWLLTGQRTPGRQVAWLTAWSGGFLLFMMVGLQVLTEVTRMPSLHGTGAKQQVRPMAK